jgi:hypothetical protein
MTFFLGFLSGFASAVVALLIWGTYTDRECHDDYDL